jgi:hypothetical protein
MNPKGGCVFFVARLSHPVRAGALRQARIRPPDGYGNTDPSTDSMKVARHNIDIPGVD